MAKAPSGYVPLNMNYMRDADIRRAGAEAEHLYIRSLAHAKAGQTDGFIGDFDLPIVAVGMKNAAKRANSLVRVGLWIEVTGGWEIRNWAKWNMTGEEIRTDKARKRESAIATNHQRWHIEKGVKDEKCPHCNGAPIGDRLATPIATPIGDGSLSEVKRSEVKSSQSEVKSHVAAVATPIVDASADAETTKDEREDVTRICNHLADRIEANGSKRPDIGKGWLDAARLMLDKDGREESDIHGAIDWSQSHEFWRSNVLSLPKLRERFDTLRLQAQRKGSTSTPTKSKAEERMHANFAVVEQLRAEEEQRTHLRAIEGNR